jgi:hypothetical protein
MGTCATARFEHAKPSVLTFAESLTPAHIVDGIGHSRAALMESDADEESELKIVTTNGPARIARSQP